MKRIKLNKTQIEQVVELRQSGHSFRAIENETGIPRRTAQRAYQEWEEKNSWEDLKRVRSDVIDREFSQHIDLLTNLAQRLVAEMDVWLSGDTPPPAEEHLIAIWEDEIKGSLGAYLQKSRYDRKERTRLERRYEMLFGALKQHTVKGVPWTVLEEWKAAWDRYRNALQDLQEQISTVMEKRCKGESDLWEEITPDQSDMNTAEFIARGILKALLKAMVEDRPSVEVFNWENLSSQESDEKVRLKETNGLWILHIPTSDGIELVEETCQSVVDQIWESKPMKSLRKESKIIQEAADTLDEALDPLRLRPMILNSRCDLCPV